MIKQLIRKNPKTIKTVEIVDEENGIFKVVKKMKDPFVIGMFVALSREQVGFSLVNKKDIFRKKKAYEIAYGRAFKGGLTIEDIPPSVLDQYEYFMDRVRRYFK